MKQTIKEKVMTLAERCHDLSRELEGLAGEISKAGVGAIQGIVKFKEAAKETGLHVNTIHNLVKRGVLIAASNGNGRAIGVTRESLTAIQTVQR